MGALEISIQGASEVLLTGEVGSVTHPDGEGVRAELLADLDAVDIVGHGLVAHGLVGGGQGAVFVGLCLSDLILEGVGIDRVEAKAERCGLFLQSAIVIDLVPGKVRRDPGGDARQLLHHGAVFQLFVNIGRLARNRELGEARAPATRAPAGGRHREAGHLLFDRVNLDAPALQSAAQAVIFILKRLKPNGVVAFDLVRGKGQAAHGFRP